MITGLNSFASRLREFISRNSGTGVSPVSSCSQTDSNDAEFNTLALELFALQFANNSPYRQFCLSRGAQPGSIAHWSRIPAVPASAFKELELTSIPDDERTTVFHSSGTTEQRPSRHFHCAESLALYEASLWPWFQMNCRLPIADCQLLLLTPAPVAAPNSSLVHMFETVRRRSGAGESAFLGDVVTDGVWTLALGRAGAAIHAAVGTGRPIVLLGTAFNFVHLIDGLAERSLSFQLPPDSVVMETGGYKGRSRELPKAELHRLITRSLGVPQSHILCEYGMSEVSSQAYDRNETRNPKPETRNFAFPPWARAQIISPETGCEVAEGETGLIRIFDLANAFSVLAIQTEDMAIRCGDGFELLGRAAAAEARGCSRMTP